METGITPVFNAVLDAPFAKVAGEKNIIARHCAAQRCLLVGSLLRHLEYPRVVKVIRASLHDLTLGIHHGKFNNPGLGRVAQKGLDELG